MIVITESTFRFGDSCNCCDTGEKAKFEMRYGAEGHGGMVIRICPSCLEELNCETSDVLMDIEGVDICDIEDFIENDLPWDADQINRHVVEEKPILNIAIPAQKEVVCDDR